MCTMAFSLRKRPKIDYKLLHEGEHLQIRRAVAVDTPPAILEGIYFAERLIWRKQKKSNKYEYLVKWDGYDVSESTWEPEDHIPACILSSFVPTEISQEKMKHFSTVFERAIQNRLTSKSPKNVVFVEFDVFRFLFGNVKSVLCDLEDLDRLNMPPHWFYKLHADGYGCKIKFPIRLTI